MNRVTTMTAWHGGSSACGVRAERSGSRWLQEPFMHLLDALAAWQERAAERRRLLGLDDRMLRDIGLDRASAFDEGGKPFWRR